MSRLIIVITLGVRFSYTVNHHFDFNLKRYRKYYSVRPFGLGKWKSLKELNRVSTFLNNNGYCEVNIWDIKNNRFKLTAFYKVEDAVEYGRDFSKYS